MTAPAIPGLAALAAECDDVELPEDVGRVWCVVRHPEFGSLTTCGETAEQAVEAMHATIATWRQRRAIAEVPAHPAVAADATAHTDEEADAA